MRFSLALLLAAHLSILHAAPTPEPKSKSKASSKANVTAVTGDVTGTFATKINIGGGNVKTDVLFTKSAIGSLEVEFQNTDGRTLEVTENKTPAPPPAGFVAAEPSSFKIKLSGDKTSNVTLQKVDYIFDATNAAVKAMNLASGQIGKLCKDSNVFIIDKAIGEIEFEADENELTLSVTASSGGISGEWGIFVPAAAAAATAATAAPSNTTTTVATPAEAADEAAKKAATKDITGVFTTPTQVVGGNVKQDILYTASAAGSLEVEYNNTVANTISVVAGKPTVAPPTGFIFLEQQTFTIATSAATSKAGGPVKVDYIFSQAASAAADISKSTVSKFDTVTKQFVPATLGESKLGEMEFEAEDQEITLTVDDLNGEWAILIPTSAVKAAT